MIRQYEEKDLSQIMALWKDFDEVHVKALFENFHYPSEAEMTKRHEKYTLRKSEQALQQYCMFVALNGESCIGFICGMIRETPDAALLKKVVSLELHAIYVTKSFRSGKVSTDLVKAMFLYGRENGAKKTVCHVWDFNKAARKHIEKLGFSKISSKYEKNI